MFTYLPQLAWVYSGLVFSWVILNLLFVSHKLKYAKIYFIIIIIINDLAISWSAMVVKS